MPNTPSQATAQPYALLRLRDILDAISAASEAVEHWNRTARLRLYPAGQAKARLAAAAAAATLATLERERELLMEVV